MKFFAINSLSHSGSTLLSLVLSTKADCISLGEIYQVVRETPETFLDDKSYLCSCGETAANCPFWGPTLNDIKTKLPNNGKRHEQIYEKYQIVLDSFAEQYGDDKYLVDTSKGSKFLSFLDQHKDLNPQVFFLLRDVRSYTHSQVLNAQKQNRKGLKKLKSWPFFLFLKWYGGNKKRLDYFQKNRISHIKIGYEELCLEPEKTESRIHNFLKVDKPASDHLQIDMPESHILYGNDLRLKKQNKIAIKYDGRWLKNKSLFWPASILWFVTRFNHEHVYSNDKT